jgi:hypothetical protein
LIIAFGGTEYVALFEIEGNHSINILVLRHPREEDYH